MAPIRFGSYRGSSRAIQLYQVSMLSFLPWHAAPPGELRPQEYGDYRASTAPRQRASAGRGDGPLLLVLARLALEGGPREGRAPQARQALLGAERVLLHLVEQFRQVEQRLGVLLAIRIVEHIDAQVVPEGRLVLVLLQVVVAEQVVGQ